MIFPTKKYSIIYCDPPWKYDNFEGAGAAYGDATAHYDTLTLDQMKEIPVKDISADNCALFMWATYPQLVDALDLMDAWGFRYRTVAFTWVKTNRDGGGYYSGLGFYTNSNAEVCLLGIKGSLERQNKDVKQIIVSPLREHSRKPDITYDRIVKLFGDLPRIELFARMRIDGWDCWGLQAPTLTQKLLDSNDKQIHL